MAERGNQMEIRFYRRMDRAEQRMDRAEQRMEKFDRRIEATCKLVEAGMKVVVRMEQQRKANEAEFRQQLQELTKPQKEFLDALRRSGNGSGRAA
ncbi:MAG TPA: hypothetical protein VEV17_15395 [Bryobacteraceae bacterium]|nr:hypothetical protein [Bryobacteraceae bacterium]